MSKEPEGLGFYIYVGTDRTVADLLSSKFEIHMRELYDYRGVHFNKHVVDGLHLYVASDIESRPGASADIQLIGRKSERNVTITRNKTSLSVSTDWVSSVPVYYSKHLGIVTTEYRVLLETSHRATKLGKIDHSGIGTLMKFGHNVSGETMWQNVKRLQFDETLVAEADQGLRIFQNANKLSFGPIRNLPQEKLLAEFHELNTEIIANSVSTMQRVLFPLSSGYDSRLILAGAANDKGIASKLVAGTYGHKSGLEVRAGQRLAEEIGIPWHHIELDESFLSAKTLSKTGIQFFSTLHMHGMYQHLFAQRLIDRSKSEPGSGFITGFMTGVPAGQHVPKLAPFFKADERPDLSGALASFPQSGLWGDADISALIRDNGWKDLIEVALNSLLQKLPGLGPARDSAFFDSITRQARFIGYHPQVLGTYGPSISPHMDPRYIEFMFQLPDKLLSGRAFLEEYFLTYHPKLAKIPSNSRRMSPLGGGRFMSALRLLTTVADRAGVPHPRFLTADIDPEFDANAYERKGLDSFNPLIIASHEELSFEQIQVKARETMTKLNYRGMEKFTYPQSLAFELEHLSQLG